MSWQQMRTWRQCAAATIVEVRLAHPEARGDELRKLLKPHYPFGVRRYWPYKAWCKAVEDACGKSAAHRRKVPLPLFD